MENAIGEHHAQRRKFRRSFFRSQSFFGFALNAPTILLIVGLVGYPLVSSFWISLHDYNLARPHIFRFVGLNNYLTVMQRAEFQEAALVTFVFVVLSVPLTCLVGLALGVITNEPFRGRGVTRTLMLLPWAMPPVVNGVMWQWIYDGRVGALNGLLYSLGIIHSYQPWLLDHRVAIVMLVLAQVWQQSSFAGLIILAGLQAIPPDLYEAAQVDGAGPIRRFAHVTLPWLMHPILIILIIQTMVALRVFDLVFVMTGGGPGNATTVVAWLAYQTAFVFLDFGKGNAYAYFIAFATLLLSLIYIRALYARGEIRQ